MKKDFKKIVIGIVVVLLVVIGAFFAYKLLHKEKKPVVEEVKKVDDIQTKEFDYVLYDNKSDLYKKFFAKLKEELLKEVVNEEEYAKIVSELFVIDFYSLSDKITSTDVGGLDFIYEEMKDNFVLKATDTIYKYVKSNVYGDRKQELPKIKSVEVKEIIKTPVATELVKDESGYKVSVTISYEKELGFPKEVVLTLVHKESKLYIIEVK